jgi:hypothetical protein
MQESLLESRSDSLAFSRGLRFYLLIAPGVSAPLCDNPVPAQRRRAT